MDVPRVSHARMTDGVVFHYTEQGRGVPIVFVHGSLVDSSSWNRELTVFSADYRAIAYSRRYNSPNTNAIRPGRSGDREEGMRIFFKWNTGNPAFWDNVLLIVSGSNTSRDS